MADDSRLKADPEINRIREATRELEKINRELRELLGKLPLKHYREVARLNWLINRQYRLISASSKRQLPIRVTILFDNARDTAQFLRAKYFEEVRKGRIRGPSPEDQTIRD